MAELEKLFEDIQNQLNEEKLKHRKLKICKHGFEISKVAILSIFERFIQLGKHVKIAINISITGAFG